MIVIESVRAGIRAAGRGRNSGSAGGLSRHTLWTEGDTGDLVFAVTLCTAGDLMIAYTVFSEWINVSVLQSWAYSELMPVNPILGTGISPIAQWVFLPPFGRLWARKSFAMEPIYES